jgi:peptidyl-prolyl cis-trans isomerase D
MIRFLQTDNRVTKALLVVIIGAASVSMCVYLIPGLMAGGSTSADTFAVVYPHWYSKYLATGDEVSQVKVEQAARQQLQQRNPQYADNPMILNFFEAQVGQQLVQKQVLLQEAEKLGIRATEDDISQYLRTGPTGEVLFPGGKFIGKEQYQALIAQRLNMSITDFEESVKTDIIVRRLQALITAGATVSDQEVRDAYRKQSTKIKFDYAVVSSDDLRKSINPSDGDLEAFFKKNATRYASAVPEQRKITYFAFTPNQLPGGVPQPTQQQIQQYFTAHQSEYSVPEQARSRHILISAPQGDAKADAAAKAKADDVLKQLQSGGNWNDLAKKFSDDPGSKGSGGELGFAQRGKMVPEFDNAIFTQKINDIKIVKSQFGYHVIQVEERNAAHTQSLSEVLPTIQATLIRQGAAQAEDTYAKSLASEAMKNGLEKTAAAHHLEVVTTPPVGRDGVVAALPDSSQLLSRAFGSKQGDPPQSAPTGEGYAIFQVTGISPAHSPTFADWKSHVLDDYRDEQLPGLLSRKTGELSERAKSENSLSQAAKEMGVSVKTSDLIGLDGQVPDVGQVAQVAPQLFDMSVGNISGPINAQRTGVVAKIVDKKEATPDEIQKNFDSTKDQLLRARQDEAFNVFMSGVLDYYKKHNLIRMSAKPKNPQLPGM